jgi:hypothetical protein
MISADDKRPLAEVLRTYQGRLTAIYPDKVQSWPLLNGWNLVAATFKDWNVYVVKDAGFTMMTAQSGFGELPETATGAPNITPQNREFVRSRLEQFFNIGGRDVILLWPPDNILEAEFDAMLRRHELAQGLAPMKIFLSHKGSDKPLVRKYKETLRLLGFDPWLDEDAMAAGTSLDRGVLDGFKHSCAAVFFVTPSFKDEKYLATEVDYAIAEKNEKGDRFAIITLVFKSGADKGTVPDLLHRFVWKEPQSDLEALQEIIRALPVRVGNVQWR